MMNVEVRLLNLGLRLRLIIGVAGLGALVPSFLIPGGVLAQNTVPNPPAKLLAAPATNANKIELMPTSESRVAADGCAPCARAAARRRRSPR